MKETIAEGKMARGGEIGSRVGIQLQFGVIGFVEGLGFQVSSIDFHQLLHEE